MALIQIMIIEFPMATVTWEPEHHELTHVKIPPHSPVHPLRALDDIISSVSIKAHHLIQHLRTRHSSLPLPRIL